MRSRLIGVLMFLRGLGNGDQLVSRGEDGNFRRPRNFDRQVSAGRAMAVSTGPIEVPSSDRTSRSCNPILENG